MLTREEIYRDIENELGIVPSFLKSLPDSVLENDWRTMKTLEMEDTGTIPIKYRHLIGLGISGAIKCSYCTYFHTVMAKAHGVTDDEIREAARYAADTSGWSTFINGLKLDFDEFKREVDQIVDYVGKKTEKREKISV